MLATEQELDVINSTTIDLTELVEEEELEQIAFYTVFVKIDKTAKNLDRIKKLFEVFEVPPVKVGKDFGFAFNLTNGMDTFDVEKVMQMFIWHLDGCTYQICKPVNDFPTIRLIDDGMGLLDLIEDLDKVCKSKFGYLLNPDYDQAIRNIVNYCFWQRGTMFPEEVRQFVKDNNLDCYFYNFNWEKVLTNEVEYKATTFDEKLNKLRSDVFGCEAFQFNTRCITDQDRFYYDRYLSKDEFIFTLFKLTNYLYAYPAERELTIGDGKKNKDGKTKGYISTWAIDYKKYTGKSFNRRKISHIIKILAKYELINKRLVAKNAYAEVNAFNIGKNNQFYKAWEEKHFGEFFAEK